MPHTGQGDIAAAVWAYVNPHPKSFFYDRFLHHQESNTMSMSHVILHPVDTELLAAFRDLADAELFAKTFDTPLTHQGLVQPAYRPGVIFATSILSYCLAEPKIPSIRARFLDIHYAGRFIAALPPTDIGLKSGMSIAQVTPRDPVKPPEPPPRVWTYSDVRAVVYVPQPHLLRPLGEQLDKEFTINRGRSVQAPSWLDLAQEVEATASQLPSVLHYGLRVRRVENIVYVDAGKATLLNIRVARK